MVEYVDALYRYAMILTGNPREAESLVQDVYVLAPRTAKEPPKSEGAKIQLLAMLRNIWQKRLRKLASAQRALGTDRDESAANLPTESANGFNARRDDTSDHERVRRAIQQLPPSCREIILLRVYEGLSYQEIATFLNCSVDKVISHLVIARGKLRISLLLSRTVPTSDDAGAQSCDIDAPVIAIDDSSQKIAPKTSHAVFTTSG